MMMLDRVFWWASLVVGVPSGAATLGFGGMSLYMWLQRPGPTRSGVTGSSLVDVVVGLAELLGKGLVLLGSMVEGVLHFLTAVSVAGLMLAGVLYLTSRGLAVGAWWGKGMATAFVLLVVIVGGLAGLTAGAGLLRPVGLGLAGLGIYTLIYGIYR